MSINSIHDWSTVGEDPSTFPQLSHISDGVTLRDWRLHERTLSVLITVVVIYRWPVSRYQSKSTLAQRPINYSRPFIQVLVYLGRGMSLGKHFYVMKYISNSKNFLLSILLQVAYYSFSFKGQWYLILTSSLCIIQLWYITYTSILEMNCGI